MGKDDWFRHTTWNPDIAAAFQTKLKRARIWDRYLSIQAATLAPYEPEIALSLVAQYFDVLGDTHPTPSIYDTIATAYIALGKFDNAISAYESAISLMEDRPQSKTNAAHDLCYLVAERQLTQYYDRAQELLKRAPLAGFFPHIAYRFYATNAAILWDKGDKALAADQACRALYQAERDHSGLSYHPKLGVVNAAMKDTEFYRRIWRISGRRRSPKDWALATLSTMWRRIAR